MIGWEDGLKGVRAGGARELIVPADQAYGGDALVYLVKILEIEPGLQWGSLDSNQGPTDYESAALTN